jgi:hypothetical protein
VHVVAVDDRLRQRLRHGPDLPNGADQCELLPDNYRLTTDVDMTILSIVLN